MYWQTAYILKGPRRGVEMMILLLVLMVSTIPDIYLQQYDLFEFLGRAWCIRAC